MRSYEFITESEQLNEGWGTVFKAIGKWLWKERGVANPGATVSAARSFISKLGRLGDITINLLGAYVLTKFVIKYLDLSDQKQKAENGDTSTEIFGNANSSKITELYNSTLEQYAGEAVVEALPVLLKAPAKLFGILGSITSSIGKGVGGVVGGAAGSTLGIGTTIAGAGAGAAIGSIPGALIKNAGQLTKIMSGGVGGVLFLGFLKSDTAQEFFKTALQGQLVQLVGGVATGLYEKAAQLLNSALGTSQASAATSAATGSSAQASAPNTPTQPTSNVSQTELPPNLAKIEQEYNAPPLKVRFDRKNPKRMYVNNIPITDDNGYRVAGKSTIDRIGSTAKLLNKPNPVANLPEPPRYAGGYY